METASTALSEEVMQQLIAVKAGDLLLIQSYPKRYDDEVADEEEDDDYEENDEVETEHIELAEEDAAEGENGSAASPSSATSSEPSGDGSDNAGADDKSTDEDEVDEAAVVTAILYAVLSVNKDSATNSITDVTLVDLTYSAQPAQASLRSFQIYGANIVHNVKKSDEGDEVSIKDLINASDATAYNCHINPTGDQIRYTHFANRCGNCHDGFLPSQTELHTFLPAATSSTMLRVSDYRPLCPSCIGLPLTQEYHNLREMLDSHILGTLDLGTIIDFYGRLNPRRRQIGYRFRQFDERDWGYLFDDLVSEDEDEGGDDGDGFERWDEAMDPNANVVARPTCREFVAMLPRKSLAEVKQFAEAAVESTGECAICKEQFNDPDLVVVELPCGHVFCDAGCIEDWLRESNNCPSCRRKFPEAKKVAPIYTSIIVGNEVVAAENPGTGDGATDEAGVEHAASEAAGDTEEQEMDGDDTVISDLDIDAVVF